MSTMNGSIAQIEDFKSPSTPPAFKIVGVPLVDVRMGSATEYLIKGIIEPSQVSIWFGPPGNAKTFLMLDLAHAIATGRPVFERRVRQATTLYLALEGRGGIDKRAQALVKVKGEAPRFLRSDDSLQLMQIASAGRPRVNREHVQELMRFIKDNTVKFAVIDTMNLTLGGADENDNSTMGELIKAAGQVATETDAHIAFVAHSAKNGTEGGPRGGGSQLGNADLVVAVSGENGVFKGSSFAPGGKIKDGGPFELHFKLNVVELATDADGDPITSCTIMEADKSDACVGTKLSKAQQGWFEDLSQCFLEVGANAPQMREPVPRLSVPTLTREQVRDGFRKRGRLGDVRVDGKIEGRYRTQMSTMLNALKDARKIGMTDKYVWLVQ